MMHLLGSGLVILATTLFAHSLIAKEKFRLDDLKEVEKGVLLLQNQVRYIGSPLGELLSSIGLQLNGGIGEIFSLIGVDMENRCGESGNAIWERIWHEKGKHTFLTAVDLTNIIDFGKSLSFLERNSKENSGELLLLTIRDTQDEIKSKLQQTQKLYYSLGVLSGLLLVVTLL